DAAEPDPAPSGDGPEGERPAGPRPADPPAGRAHTGEGDGPAASSRGRRPVVFDEDDDLDVPDFLK
ncbi:cell division protein FtsZ, partial [Actinomadura rayongensis]